MLSGMSGRALVLAAAGGIVAALALEATTTATGRAASGWGIRDLGTLGGRVSTATAVNERGQVVGRSQVDPKSGKVWHAFVWQNGRMLDIGTLGGTTSGAVAINERGQVIGGSTTASGASHAFLWQTGTMTDLGTLGGRPANKTSGPQTEAVGINDRGQIAGMSWTKQGVRHAFRWENGEMRDLGSLGAGPSIATAINNRGDVVGWSRTERGTHAFLWRDGKMIDLGTLGGSQSAAEAINDRGQIAGFSEAPHYRDDFFVWQDGRMRAIGIKNGSLTFPVGINDRGQIAGYGSLSIRHLIIHALVWWSGRVHDLGTLGGTESRAASINKRGTVVGWSDTRACAAAPRVSPCRHGFVWSGGTLVDLGTLGGRTSEATAIADNGRIAGSSLTSPKPKISSVRHAVLWEP